MVWMGTKQRYHGPVYINTYISLRENQPIGAKERDQRHKHVITLSSNQSIEPTCIQPMKHSREILHFTSAFDLS